jgi:hypothetical protein
VNPAHPFWQVQAVRLLANLLSDIKGSQVPGVEFLRWSPSSQVLGLEKHRVAFGVVFLQSLVVVPPGALQLGPFKALLGCLPQCMPLG